jgi:hypothetical protein
MALVIVTACSYFLFKKRSGDSNLQAVINDDVVEFLEDVVDDGLSDDTGGAANVVERECIVEDSGEVSVGCDNDLVGVRKEIPILDAKTLWGLQDVVEQGNQVDGDGGGDGDDDDSDISDEEIKQDAVVNDKSTNHEGMEDVDEIEATTTMDNKLETESLPKKVEKSSELNAENPQLIDPILQKRCKNLFHKIFNKKCRKKKQKKKGGPISINLQAIAGI